MSFIVTDIDLDRGESEVYYGFVFQDIDKDEEIILEGTYDVQAIVLYNQDKFTFDEEPTIETITRIFHECAEKYPSSRSIQAEHFGYNNGNLLYKEKYSIIRYGEIIDFELETDI